MAHAVWRDRVWFDPGGPATQESIRALEAAVGAPIPASITEFLHVVNGASCDYAVTLSPGLPTEAEACFSDWFRAGDLTDADYGTILGERSALEAAWFRKHLPERFLPIVRTGSEDDVLLVDLSDEAHGTMVAWISGLPPAWGGPTKDVLHVAAPSIEEFVARMFISDAILEIGWPPRLPADRDAWLDLGPRIDPARAESMPDSGPREGSTE